MLYPGSRKTRVLIVEDYPDARELYAEYLRMVGFEVVTAEDGEQGLASATLGSPDVVILDLHLPKLDGLAILRALRAEGARRRIPVLVLTADIRQDATAAANAAGADAVMKKPCLPDDLDKAIRTLVGH